MKSALFVFVMFLSIDVHMHNVLTTSWFDPSADENTSLDQANSIDQANFLGKYIQMCISIFTNTI